MNDGPGRSGAPRVPAGRIALIWALLCVLLLVTGARNILIGQFPDPDDTLRLVQVRDWLAGQPWFDVTQYRIDPPGGVPMHWSRLVDLPLAALALGFEPLVGAAGAERAAAVLVPLLTLGCLVAVVGWIASRRFDPEVTGFACLACAITPATVAMVQPLRIDHHGWQVVTVMLAAATLFARDPLRGAYLAGLFLATGLIISLEVLPFAAAFGAVLALAWLRNGAAGGRLAAYLVSLAVSVAALFLATRGPDALAPWCDAVAPPHLAFFAAVAGFVWLGSRRAWPVWGRLAVLAGAGGSGLALFGGLAPQCLAAPFGNLDPVVEHYWYRNVAEGLPFWRQSLRDVAGALPQLAAAGLALAWIYTRAQDRDRQLWRDYALLFLGACAAGLLVWRSIAFAGALAAVPLGWLLTNGLRHLRERRGSPAAGAWRRPVLMMGALSVVGAGLWLAPAALAGNAPAADPAAAASPPAVRESRCELGRNAARLSRFAPTTIFAPLDIGPSLLERTDHAVVATGHHRAQRAMRDVIDAFRADDVRARDIVRQHGATLLVVCTDLVEPSIYADDAPSGLMARLLFGSAPEWLEPLDIGAPAQLKVWRVRAPAS